MRISRFVDAIAVLMQYLYIILRRDPIILETYSSPYSPQLILGRFAFMYTHCFLYNWRFRWGIRRGGEVMGSFREELLDNAFLLLLEVSIDTRGISPI